MINIFATRKFLFACMYVTDRKTSTKAGNTAVIWGATLLNFFIE
jgi:hypothetical protein